MKVTPFVYDQFKGTALSICDRYELMSHLMARRATLYARSLSCGSRAEKRYLAKVCIGTLSLWMTSPRPLYQPAVPRQGRGQLSSGLCSDVIRLATHSSFNLQHVHVARRKGCRTVEKLCGLFPKGLNQQVVQLQLLQLCNDLLFVPTHLRKQAAETVVRMIVPFGILKKYIKFQNIRKPNSIIYMDQCFWRWEKAKVPGENPCRENAIPT